MRIVLPIVISACAVWAQSQPAGAAKPAGQPNVIKTVVPAESIIPIAALPPETIIATIDGRKITAGELQSVIKTFPQQQQQQVQSNPKAFVEQYGVMLKLAEEAKKDKLDQQSPYKEAIEAGTLQVLSQAEINAKMTMMPVSDEDIKTAYETGKANYVQAKVRGIYLQFSTSPTSQADSKGKKLLTEEEAKAKAAELVKQLRAGGDFAALAKEHSGDPSTAAKGGELGTLHKSDRLPADVKKVIFDAKAGEVTEPTKQVNGYWIFKVDEVAAQPFEEVKGAIAFELKNKQFMAWLGTVQKSMDIKMEHEPSPAVKAPPSLK